MNNWKSASEMCSYTQRNIDARDARVNHDMPYYMDKAMERIVNRANDCEFFCICELHPEKGEDMEYFDQIVSAVRKKLKSLGYSVTNNQTRYGVKVSWSVENSTYPRV